MGHEPLAAGNDPMVNSAAAAGDPRDPGVAKDGVKGGSFLCAANYGSSPIGIRLATLSRPLPQSSTSPNRPATRR
jgi:hypothetical protein